MAEPIDQPRGYEDEDDDEREGDLHRERRHAFRGGRVERIPLHDLLQILAGQRVVVDPDQRNADSNDDLVANLKRSGMLSSDSVAQALLACPRGSFVPEGFRDEAWMDTPIRVESQDFNISAPHMHATMLQALELAAGDRVLDVGCGCGIVTACAAFLVGKQGRAVGVDVKQYCVDLCTTNVRTLTSSSTLYSTSACPPEFQCHNVFMPCRSLQGAFNKVHVGAACPEERVHMLMDLLEPSGGLLLVPVGSDLRLYEKKTNGDVSHRLVSSVRFSDLVVPSDAEIVLALVDAQREAALQVHVSPSTWASDMEPLMPGGVGILKVASCNGHSSKLPGSSFLRAAARCVGVAGPSKANDMAPGPSGRGSDDVAHDDVACERDQQSKQLQQLLPAADCRLKGREHGQAWELAVHKAVLKARCQHFRARLSSGMRDADDGDHDVPEHFKHSSMEQLVQYVYHDCVEQGLSPAQVVDVLHVACYYGVPRLIELCEERLAMALTSLDPSSGALEAPGLLVLSDELALEQLRRVAIAYLAQHFEAAQAGEGWRVLGKEQVDAVAAELSNQLGSLRQALKALQPPPEAARRRAAALRFNWP